MSKSKRQRQLELLKSLAANHKQLEKLALQKQVELVQTSMLEKELVAMKQHLEMLKARRPRVTDEQEELATQETEGNAGN